MVDWWDRERKKRQCKSANVERWRLVGEWIGQRQIRVGPL
jgi:hypothetical protein